MFSTRNSLCIPKYLRLTRPSIVVERFIIIKRYVKKAVYTVFPSDYVKWTLPFSVGKAIISKAVTVNRFTPV